MWGEEMIKPVSLQAPYVYLDYLKEFGHTDVWDNAVSMVSSLNGNLNNSSHKLQEAINFLYSIAQSQRAKEVDFIQNKLKEMEFNKTVNDEELKNLNEQLKTIIKNINNKNFNYQEFSALLNKVIERKDILKGRLLSLLDNLNHNKTRKNLGIYTKLGNEFLTIIDLLKQEKKEIEEKKRAARNVIPDIIYNYLLEQGQNLQYDNPSALFAALMKMNTEFRYFLEKQHKLKKIYKRDSYDKQYKELYSLFKEFIKEEENNDIFSQSPQSQKELLELTKIFNLTNLEDAIKTQKKFEEIAIPNLPNITFNDPDYLSQVIFFSTITSNAISERMSSWLFKVGDLMAITGPLNLGDDGLIGAIGCKFQYNDDELDILINILEDTLNSITAAEKEFVKHRQDQQNYNNNLQKMNNEVEKALILLNQQFKNLNTDAFIIHESDKYYETLESGAAKHWNGKTKKLESGFGGRTLPILNYIDTMTNIGMDLGVNPNALKFIGLNLAPHAVANGSDDMLASIFSMAASLIMFDDAPIIFKEAVGTLEFSNLTNLHLYNLEGLYYPASYIIEQSAIYLSGCPVSETDAAQASIILPDLNLENAKNGQEDVWESIKKQASSDTQVTIHFFLNFVDFISKIKP